MPKYRVQLSDGRIVTVEGDQPPTEQDVLAQLGPKQETPDEGGMVDSAINALPTIGGTVGSLVGGGKWNPLGMAGAAVGGAAGEAFKQTANAVRGRLDLVPATIPDQLKSIGAAGAVQGGLEGIGRGVIAPAAKGLYGVAMRPIQGLRKKYGLGTLINEGFENRVMPTKGGADKAMGKVKESKATQRGMAEAYDQSGGAPLQPVKAAKAGLGPVVKQAKAAQSATGTGGAAVKTITKRVQSVRKAHPQGMKATEMMDAKHAADDIADPAYVAARRTGAAVDPGSKAGIAKGWSQGYRGVLNDAVGPEFAKQGQKTKALFGVSRMADYAAERPEMASNIMSGVAGAASSGGDMVEGLKDAAIYRTILSPRVQAGAAFAAVPAALYGTRGLDAATGSQGEQALREALLQMLSGGGAPQP
jgi:hypothetical protein